MEFPLHDYVAGARVATDLVTTSPTVRGPAGDGLPSPEALAAFLADHDLRLDAPPPTATDLFQVQLLRREARGIIETETADQAVAGCAVLMRRAALGPVLRRDAAAGVDGRWRWHVPTAPGAPLADELAAFLAAGLAGVVRALGHGRFRDCAAPGCRGVFADTSRTGRRRFCRPELCGNRVKVANHRARQAVR
ncbi:CGNR zinc finger domain-containing protein [Streptomyces millisiae]|uniref:CGNR zinc finger domain-containing protein n=1 Tax=Streptomyces millisiae TaxID=3075542 RepID=A0ABU2LZ31_9ACTN|nr:CGNR zinc finger domain-containing protein [Streptomyces sp. DSM 44918]MDT0322855.1 CGNR zinc finger domain-containing protein [Streptomyces sp. DSM 44918]